MVTYKSHQKLKLTAAVMLALASVTAKAEFVELGSGDNNFTMLDPSGAAVGGTNDVVATWDGSFNTSVETAVTNMTLSSTTPFFGVNWFAHDVKVYGAGTYEIDACPGGADPDKPGFGMDGSKCGGPTPITMEVGEGQAGVHMLFDWNGNVNIDVYNVWDMESVWQFSPNDGGGKANQINTEGTECILKGADKDPDAAVCDSLLREEFLFTATDPDGDGVPGSPMVDGPFTGFNASFNIRAQVVPVPAAVWLMGSGLLGLVGVARRKKR